MSSQSSLQGKKVLVPRGKHQAKSFSDIVRSYGGVPVEIPLLAFRPVPFSKELQSVFQSLNSFDWIILTSNVAVETFFSFLRDQEVPLLPKIAVIGEKTEQVLLKKGFKVHFRPKEYVAESFVEGFLPIVKKGDRVLIPKGNLARDLIGSSLRKKGVLTQEITIYETYFPEDSKEKLLQYLKDQELDVLSFTSPSTVDHFMSVVNEYSLQEAIHNSVIACIGPIAKKRAESFGLKVHAMPEVYTVHDMVISIISYLNKPVLK